MAVGTRTLSSVVSPIRNSSLAIKDSKKKTCTAPVVCRMETGLSCRQRDSPRPSVCTGGKDGRYNHGYLKHLGFVK